MKYTNRAEDLKVRTKRFVIGMVRLVRYLPKSVEGRVIGNQVLRSGTSMAANYRAACRARSRAEFLAKLGVVVEEADETIFWLEVISEAGIHEGEDTDELLKEAHQLLAIFAASQRTARRNNAQFGKGSSSFSAQPRSGQVPFLKQSINEKISK